MVPGKLRSPNRGIDFPPLSHHSLALQLKLSSLLPAFDLFFQDNSNNNFLCILMTWHNLWRNLH